jgi:hypothetical protein
MKALLYFFVMAILLIAGCAKDDTMFETQDNLELKKAKVPIPFKADCFGYPDTESDLISWNIGDDIYLSYSRIIITGTGTHLGKINSDKSYYEFESIVYFTDDDGIPYTMNSGKGKVVAANGDSFEITFQVKNLFDENASYTGNACIIPGSGTGKFEDCTGTFGTVGASDYAKGGTWFKLDGYLVYE